MAGRPRRRARLKREARRNEGESYPSVQFEKSSEQANAAVRRAWRSVRDAQDALHDYQSLYRELLRDLPNTGEWREAHETAKRQLSRIDKVALKEASDLEETCSVMADDILVLMWKLPGSRGL